MVVLVIILCFRLRAQRQGLLNPCAHMLSDPAVFFRAAIHRHGWMLIRPGDPKGLSVLTETPHLARPRQKLPASAYILTARHDSSFTNHAL
jgi:hypothetical protein